MAVQRDKIIASAEKLVAKGKIEPAIKEYERLLDDNPNDVNTLNRIGDLWVRINRNDEAVKVFGKIADHYSKDGFFLKAIAIYKKINKLDPSKLDIYAKLADLYAKQGLAMEAKSQYQVLADYYLKHGDPGNALAIYRKISELDPNSINVHVKLADLYSQNNQTSEALKEYDRVGKMLLKRGMLDEAVQVFRKALKIDGSNVDLVDSLVTALLEARDFDNAMQIVQTSLDSNADNVRLLALQGRIFLAKGDAQSARKALERGLAVKPDEPAIRESLAELYLKVADPDKALSMISPNADKALAKGERGAAVEMFNRILRVDATHAPTLERLVALYSRLNEETNILASMNSLAEAHMGKGNYDDAARVLEKLIEREPQNAQHRNKLQFVKSQMGGIDTIPAHQKSAPEAPPQKPPQQKVPAQKAPAVAPPVSLEIEEPEPTFGLDDDNEITLGLDDSPAIELELEMESPQPSAPPPPPPKPAPAAKPAPPPAASPTHLTSAVEIAAAEIAGEAGDDLDFITEHLTEAEVFAKYGLSEKAIEHLRAVIDRSPKYLVAHERLYRILLDEGDIDGAKLAASQYVSLLQDLSDTTGIDAVRHEFTTRGQTFTVSAPRTMEAPLPPPVAIEEEVEELTFDLDSPVAAEDLLTDESPAPVEELEFSLDEPEGLPALQIPEPETFLSLEPETELETLPDLEPDLLMESESELLMDSESELLMDSEPDLGFSMEPELLSIPEPVIEPEALELEPETASAAYTTDEDLVPPVAETGNQVFLGDTFEEVSPVVDEPAIEEIGEIDFYIEQELFDEARTKVEALLARFPGNADLTSRAAKVRASAALAATPRPPALSRDEIESELLSAIPDDDDDLVIPAPPPPPPSEVPAAPVFDTSSVEEGNLFADEDDFFDLAAELESELDEENDISLSEEEQSLEEIFKEFKKGVEQQLDSEDYDTHYNLGIAYKEMGLIDEAIGEFQLASKDPKRSVECASMLGLCFLEKGMPQLAIKWYRKGLEMPEISEEEHVGLLYDLGSAYVEVGDTDNAQKAFMEVYGMNSNYREVVTRIKQLEDARK
jgi:pilus assembly protein FimV